MQVSRLKVGGALWKKSNAGQDKIYYSKAIEVWSNMFVPHSCEKGENFKPTT